jgi:hypothetical protein
MKVLLLLPLLQLLVISIPCISIDPTQLVYDAEGKELSSDFDYYVLLANQGNGGGLTYVPSGLRCLNFVAQESNGTLFGIPLVITRTTERFGRFFDPAIERCVHRVQ